MSEVLNKALLRALAEILDVGDVKQFASELATDRIIPVAPVFAPIAAPQFRYVDYNESDNLVGLATASWTIVTCGAGEIARILALEVSVAGPTKFSADDPTILQVQGFYSLEEVGCKVFHFPEWGHVSANVEPWQAHLAKGGFQVDLDGGAEPATLAWDGLVPPGKSFSVQVDSVLNFPANAVGTVRAIYAIGPAPFQPPI